MCTCPASSSAKRGIRCRLWLALLFGALGVSILYARLPLVHAFVCLAAIVLLDAVVVAVRATQLQAPPDVAVIAFAAMLTSHIAAALAARSHEESIRAAFALQCALRSAAADARRLLDDLFPPTAVRALLAGHLVPPRVADCAAVWFCDLAGFTRLASSLSPREVMRTADAIFSAFDGLVQVCAVKWQGEHG